MLNFLLLMVLPTLIAVGLLAYYKGRLPIWEFFAQLGVVALMTMLGLFAAYEGRTADTEIWNGRVIEKESHHVSCSHSYQCNCYYTEECTSDGKSQSCTMVQHCSTCYEHLYDVDWTVHASTGEAVDIDRIDRQGLDMPPRWGRAYVGEPFSSQHTYTNYIKANPESVLLGSKGDMARFGKMIPPYPDQIYDYYYHDPAMNMGVPNVDMKVWNWLIREANKQLGPQKQVNIILLLVPTNDRAYMLALKDAWIGGKKNDAVVVIGSTDGHEIGFADVMSWSTNKTFAVGLKNRIQEIGTLDQRDGIQKAIITTTQTQFVRLHMKSMKWLMRSFQPSGTAMILLFVFAVLLEGGLAYWTIRQGLTE
jgi:hypothetical protein